MKLNMEGMDQVRARMDALRNSLEDLGPAYLRSAVVILDSAKAKIQSQDSNSWFISRAMQDNPKGTPLHRTGRLFNSFTAGGEGNAIQEITGGISVGTNVNYARYLQEGTKYMPPRRFLYVDEQLADGVKKVFIAHLMGGAL